MKALNPVVLLCGIHDDQLPDAYGPFNDEASATKYLAEKHANPGWMSAPESKCFGDVVAADHVIIPLFK